MTALPPSQQASHVAVPYRYKVTCWNDACTLSLDTYGKTEEVLAMAQEHADRNGCTLRVQVKSIIEITPRTGQQP